MATFNRLIHSTNRLLYLDYLLLVNKTWFTDQLHTFHHPAGKNYKPGMLCPTQATGGCLFYCVTDSALQKAGSLACHTWDSVLKKNLIVRLKPNDLAVSQILLPNRQSNYLFPVHWVTCTKPCFITRSAKNSQLLTKVSIRSLPISQHNSLVEKAKALLSFASLSQLEHWFWTNCIVYWNTTSNTFLERETNLNQHPTIPWHCLTFKHQD